MVNCQRRWKMVDQPDGSQTDLISSGMRYLYKNQIRLKINCCSCIWVGASQSPVSSLDRVQSPYAVSLGIKCFPLLQSVSHRRNIAILLLLYHYFNVQTNSILYCPLRSTIQYTQIRSDSSPHIFQLHDKAQW